MSDTQKTTAVTAYDAARNRVRWLGNDAGEVGAFRRMRPTNHTANVTKKAAHNADHERP
jgi:hypothetical protein